MFYLDACVGFVAFPLPFMPVRISPWFLYIPQNRAPEVTLGSSAGLLGTGGRWWGKADQVLVPTALYELGQFVTCLGPSVSFSVKYRSGIGCSSSPFDFNIERKGEKGKKPGHLWCRWIHFVN